MDFIISALADIFLCDLKAWGQAIGSSKLSAPVLSQQGP
jgi:hypothetical protein